MRQSKTVPFREAKTEFLRSLLPKGVTLSEHWVEGANGKFFSAWYIYRHYTGAFAWIRNFFVMEPMIAIDAGMSPATVFDESEPELYQRVLDALKKGIKERYNVDMRSMGVPAYL